MDVGFLKEEFGLRKPWYRNRPHLAVASSSHSEEAIRNVSKMSNRKARRAAAANGNITSAADIPLAQPSREKPAKHKTLYDIAAERQAALFPNASTAPLKTNESNPEIITTKINKDGSISHSKEPQHATPEEETEIEKDEELPGPLSHALLYAVTFTMLHFTLDVLVHNQYRISIGWDLIFQRAATAFPALLLLIYFFRPRAATVWAQALFLAGSVGAGCYLVKSSNEDPYFAVMKRAPPLGTLWIWCVLEQRLEVAVAGLAVVGGYFWWGGYGIFGRG